MNSLRMPRAARWAGWITGALFSLAGAWSLEAAEPPLDLVIEAGRVIDPESGLDAVRNVGIRDGKVVALTAEKLSGRRVIDARGLTVAPGFIDLHAHGQQLPAARMQAFDGMTTALELEVGLLPVDRYYEQTAREGRPINYGIAASWGAARQAVMDGLEPQPSITGFQRGASATNWSSKIANEEQTRAIAAMIEQGLKEGALGVGFNIGYAPPSGRKEYYEMNKLAAAHGAPTFTHIRYMSVDEPQSAFEAYQEMVAVAAATGARMHICHLNSTSLRDAPKVIELISSAQKRGVPLTVEAYPYAAASTVIGAAMFRGPNWRERLGGVSPADFEHDGVTLNEETFAALQKNEPGAFIVFKYLRPDLHPADQEMLDRSVLFPGGAIASDGLPWTVNGKVLEGDLWPLPANAFAHPRGAGTFTRFLREYVRERQLISLPEAIRKVSLIPAQILEDAVPQMRDKGRLRVGADADIVVFDAQAVSDRATFDRPAQTSVGMRWVLVGGTPVIDSGKLKKDALPGRAIRRRSTAT
jgi:N-acyl-D-glutamate deacylase